MVEDYPCDAPFWNAKWPGLGEICKVLEVEPNLIDSYTPWDWSEPMCENRVKTPHTLCERCTRVLAKCAEYWSDPDKLDPTTAPSQQPHGKQTMYCNICNMYVKPTTFLDDEETCPYHQQVRQTEEGPVFMYDEFDQDGN